MPDVKIKGKVRSMICTIATGTVIEAGDLVALSNGLLIIKATATSTKVALALQASASGDTEIEVTRGNVDILMDCEDAFAVTHKGGEYDIAVSGAGKQTLNQSGNTYKVIMVDPSQDAGTVGATTNIKCVINKPLDARA